MPELITGTKGTPHITSTQDRAIYEKIIGKNSYILDDNELLEPELQSNQSLRIRSGMLYHHGSITEVKRNTYDEVTIANGSQGMKRIDLVVARYTKNPETEIEEMNWVVIQGTPAASDPVAPAYTEGNMQEGDLTDDCPVFEVHLDGIQVTEVVKLLTVLSGSLESLNSNKPSVEEVYSATGIQKNLVANQASSYVFQQTVEKAGYVYVEVNTNFPAGNNRKRIVLKKNDDTVTQSDFTCGTSGVSAWMTASAMVPVFAGDVLAAQLLCATAGMTSSDVRITGFFVNT